MARSESVRLVHAARLEIPPPYADAMRREGARDERLGVESVTEATRLVIAAWAMAVDGDDTALAAMSLPEVARLLLHQHANLPPHPSWHIAHGPAVTQIEIAGFDVDAEPPQLRIRFDFTGRRETDNADRADYNDDDERPFVGLLRLKLREGGGQRPWQLESGHVETLDQFLGYVFTSCRETPEEYRKRTGSAADPVADNGPTRRFRLIAGFAEHDERFGSHATVEVRRPVAPTRAEAEELIWPVIWQVTTRTLGAGDWAPSLLRLDVIELLADQ